MSFLVLWVGLVALASAVVLSFVVWRRQRDHRVLLLTGLLIAVGSGFSYLAATSGFAQGASTLTTWLCLATAVVGLGAVAGLDRMLTAGRRRELTINQILAALHETETGLSGAIGWEFFRHAVKSLTRILQVDIAYVGELTEDGDTIDILALSERGRDGEPFTYSLAGSPCAGVVGRESRIYTEGVQHAFPDDALLGELGIEAYVGVPLFGPGDRPLGLLAVLHKAPLDDAAAMLPAMRVIAARAAAELQREQQDRSLRRSERRYRTLFEESLDALYITTIDGRMVDANPAAVTLFGYDSREQILKEFAAEAHYTSRTDRQTVMDDLLRAGRFKDYPIEVQRRDGTRLDVLSSSVVERDASGKPVLIRGTLRDVTRERELQRQLMSAQRMEAVGRMAGGVAHDFNNMLTVINGHSDLLLEDLDPDSSTASDVREIKSAVESAAAFTRRLLLLSRRRVLAPERTDLNRVMGDLSLLLQKAVGEDVVMELDLAPDLGHVVADATELEQVLLNLVINARDAMPAGGKLFIVTRRLELDRDAAIERGLDAGPWIELRVTDQGLGMEPEVMDHIFEPFFTTKDPTIGTGLGLSTVYGIVRQLGGDIAVESAVGHGTTFSILMPPAPGEGEDDTATAVVAAPKARRHETLLVVDDEPAVRHLLGQFLQRQGYQVLLAGDAREALDQLEERGRVDLLISDIMMPGLRGDRLATLARELQSDLRVLLMSGNNLTGDPALTIAAPAAFLGKPFSTRDLGTAIRRLLDHPA